MKMDLKHIYSNQPAPLSKVQESSRLPLYFHQDSSDRLYAKREESDKRVQMRRLILVDPVQICKGRNFTNTGDPYNIWKPCKVIRDSHIKYLEY